MLQVKLLGATSISLDGQEVSLTGRPLALLAYLLLVRQPRMRLKLAQFFHEDTQNPQAQFRWTLNKLKQVIGSEYLIIDRQSVSFDFDAAYELDVNVLETGVIEAYRGELLSGLHLNSAAGFMNWLLFRREAYRQQYESFLIKQLNSNLQVSNWEAVIKVAHRLLELDNLREEWLMPLMQAYEKVGNVEQALSLYEIYQRALKSDLNLEPGQEIRRFAAQLVAKSEQKQSLSISQRQRHPPAYLHPGGIESVDNSFVARRSQRQRLNHLLDKAVFGKGQICFIKGNAGSGKTALIQAFIQNATKNHPELLIAYGRGTSLNQVGVPYQPFIDILAMLLADLETAVNNQLLPLSQARRLWEAYPQTFATIKTFGPDLLTNWFSHQEQKDSWQELGHSQSQAILFQQLALTLTELSRHHPLLLILDDLHWADESSISLFFHLSQRLEGHKVFLVGAYREEEISYLKTIHNQTILEIQRRSGNRAIDLGAPGEDENKDFVNTLLDRDLNLYSEQFRNAFLQQTNGHPLFATELLEALKMEGTLFQDRKGYWGDKREIVWQKLPTRIEAVIGNRLNKLSEEVQQMLAVASVEGETFTIQATAQVMGYDNRSLLKILEPASTQSPQIIHQVETVQLKDSPLLQFRFSQTLFQQYLYQQIHPAEAKLLHGEIAEALETVYAEADKSIGASLGYHYEKAGLLSKAVHYYQAAAETAVSQYANEAAIFYFTKALDLLPQNNLMTKADLLLASERLNDLLGNREEQARDLQMLQEIVEQSREPQLASVYLLRKANYLFNLNDFVKAEEQASQVIQNNYSNLELKLMAYQILGRILLMRGKVEGAREVFISALECAEELTTIGVEATIFRNFGLVSSLQGELTIARSYLDKAHTLHSQAKSTLGEAKTLQSLSIVEHQNGHYSKALQYAEQALSIFQKVGSRKGEAETLQQIGAVNGSLGNFQHSIQYLQKARQDFRVLDDQVGEAMALGYLCAANYQKKQFLSAQGFAETAIQRLESIDLLWHKNWLYTLLAKTVIRRNQWDAARLKIEAAKDCWLALALSPWNLFTQTVELELAYETHDFDSAQKLIWPILDELEERMPNGAEDPFYIYAVCYKVLNQLDNKQAVPLLKRAYFQLEKIARKITDKQAQQAFRTNILSNQVIIICYGRDVEEQI